MLFNGGVTYRPEPADRPMFLHYLENIATVRSLSDFSATERKNSEKGWCAGCNEFFSVWYRPGWTSNNRSSSFHSTRFFRGRRCSEKFHIPISITQWFHEQNLSLGAQKPHAWEPLYWDSTWKGRSKSETVAGEKADTWFIIRRPTRQLSSSSFLLFLADLSGRAAVRTCLPEGGRIWSAWSIWSRLCSSKKRSHAFSGSRAGCGDSCRGMVV